MNTEEETQHLLTFFKALVDADRLKIAGLVGIEPLTISQLAERLKLRPADVAEHLAYLVECGFVRSDSNCYRLDNAALEQLARSVLANSHPKANPDNFEGEDYERKVLSDYIAPDGTLKSIPSQHKKRLIVLHYLVQSFDPVDRYVEKQVNEILKRFFSDYASLRRYLIDDGLMQREKGEYWRVNV